MVVKSKGNGKWGQKPTLGALGFCTFSDRGDPGYFREIGKVGEIFFHLARSMYGTFSYIYHTNQPNVGEYTIHGWYGQMAVFFVG